jgi:RNA polymerase sigma-70 factor (ECF subfamily)
MPLDADEFTAAFAAHGSCLWLIAAAWVGRADADDLVQEAAVVGWQRRRSFAAGSDARAWLAQIVRHLGANWRRRRRPEPRAHEQLPETAAPVHTPQWPVDLDHLPDELARALQTLPEVSRACLLLHSVLELPFTEIASALQINENTAMSHTHRARQTLRAALPAPTTRPIALP